MTTRKLVWLVGSLVLGNSRAGEAQQASAPAAPDSTHLAAAHDLLEAMGTVNNMLAVVKAALPAQRAAMPRVPAEFWDRFEARVEKDAPELRDSMTVVYARTFSLDDLHALTEFYRSPVGRRLIGLQPTLAAEGVAIGQRWGARVGAEVAASLTVDSTAHPPGTPPQLDRHP